MHFTTPELTALVGAYLWPFFRIGAMLMAMPIIGVKTVSRHVRISFAVVLTLLIAPLVPEVPQVDPFSADAIFIVIVIISIINVLDFII